MIRLIVPDSHGDKIDKRAKAAFLQDVAFLKPREVVFLGDHVDAGSLFDGHQPNARDDIESSYEEDVTAANDFLTEIQERCSPRCQYWYIEGNHEHHIERWAVRNVPRKRDVDDFIRHFAPHHRLQLKERGMQFIGRFQRHSGLSAYNTLRLGKCLFTHGYSASKHATAAHLVRAGMNIVHGHTHRAQSYVMRSVAGGMMAAFCPGTLSILQPTYAHTSSGVTDWSHGYAIQFVAKTGTFLHVNVPITRHGSMLKSATALLKPKPEG